MQFPAGISLNELVPACQELNVFFHRFLCVGGVDDVTDLAGRVRIKECGWGHNRQPLFSPLLTNALESVIHTAVLLSPYEAY